MSAPFTMEDVDIRLGGAWHGRPLDHDDPFEAAVLTAATALGIMTDKQVAIDFWSSLSNPIWRAPDGKLYAGSYRYAGDVVAAIRQDGTNYANWYCSAPEDTVIPRIAEAMEAIGWHHVPDPEEPPPTVGRDTIPDDHAAIHGIERQPEQDDFEEDYA